MKCEICNKELNGIRGLSVHLAKHHMDILSKDYYDKYLKKEDEGKCYFCGNPAIFFDLSKGYHKICGAKECLGKTRATGTPEFLMYKYGLSKKDALLLNIKRSKERGEKIKNSLDKNTLINKNFHREKSHQCIEYWLKRGYNEEESRKKVEEVFNDIHEKTWNKRRKNPELYKDVNTTQLNYWMKKGFSEIDAIEKIKDRQRTFTLKSCIDKYGEEEGLIIYNNRQEKWSEKIEIMYRNGEFVKFRKEPYSKNEIDLFDYISDKLNIKNKVHYGKDQFFRYFPNIGRTFSYDFVYEKKIIEFNGDYWHCNPKYYNANYFHKYLQMFAYEIWERDELRIKSIAGVGFDVLVIWEDDLSNNNEKTIQKCMNFLNS